MNTKTKQTIQTDRAWINLHSRLLKDGLVEEAPATRSKQPLFAGKWQWAAATVLLISCSLGVYFGLNRNEQNEQSLLSIRNEQPGSTLVKMLEDGSVIYLSEDTELSYPEHFTQEKREVSLTGNAFFEVTGSKSHPFLIHTAYTDIEVIGTAFEVKSPDQNSFELSVLEGEVKVMATLSDKVMFVKAGDAVTITPDGEWDYKAITDTNILNRIKSTLRFRNEPVGNIIRIINKHQATDHLSIDPALEYRRLTVTFSGQTPEEVAGILSITLGVNYKKENELFIISE